MKLTRGPVRTKTLIGLLSAIFLPAVEAQSLIANGSFETPTVYPSPFLTYVAGSIFGSDWIVVASDRVADIIPNGHPGFPITPVGSQFAYVADSVLNGTIAQDTVEPLVAGVGYRLSFIQATLSPVFGGTVGVSIAPTGGGAGISLNSSLHLPATETEWVHRSIDFVPSVSGFYTISLSASAGFAALVDDVRFTSVPEPKTWGQLTGVTLVAFGAWRRRAVG